MRYFFDTKKLMTWCGCGAMGIDACLLVKGCEGYIRIIVDKDNSIQVKK
jgi:hypothetical protein